MDMLRGTFNLERVGGGGVETGWDASSRGPTAIACTSERSSPRWSASVGLFAGRDATGQAKAGIGAAVVPSGLTR